MQALSVPPVDVIEAGAGPVVVLVHSAVSGARQWKKLIDEVKPTHRVLAPNLYGYGATPPWPAERPQQLADQAALVVSVVPEHARGISIVGHSLGGGIAMKTAARLGRARVDRLLLWEPNPFYLLDQAGRSEAYKEAQWMRETVRRGGDSGDWTKAAEVFADYWAGAGAWAQMPADRRAAFTEALKPNYHEWDTVMNETTPVADWVDQLPTRTLVCYDPATMRPMREIVEILRDATPWQFREVPGAGHMAPFSRPELANPIIRDFLCA